MTVFGVQSKRTLLKVVGWQVSGDWTPPDFSRGGIEIIGNPKVPFRRHQSFMRLHHSKARHTIFIPWEAAKCRLYYACEVKEDRIRQGKKFLEPEKTSVYERAKNSVLDWYVDTYAIEVFSKHRNIDFETQIYNACKDLKGETLQECLHKACRSIVYP